MLTRNQGSEESGFQKTSQRSTCVYTVGLLGGVPNAYVGFTSGTGADYGNHDILSWEYRDTFDPIDPKPVPEPSATVPLVGLGLMSLGFMYHRRKSN
ncbi:MAG TPA: hypothetical protein DCL61_05650 [Cyanobacteria bacterium UBA12227]|nr:hypothetical protein [Cyanobacteria bacterium UBA12227]HAX88277.1 hypothetical protein [Cyanobacteria bacterium UBA11370]HBY81702.1 hypothetical protein [Cyanobacteria bacterium UBA11148]